MRPAPWNHVAFLLPLAIMSVVLWTCRRSIVFGILRYLPWGHSVPEVWAPTVLMVLALSGTTAALAGTFLARRARR
jgi:hypothetical protein